MLGQEKTRELLEQELERLRNENHRLKEELTSLKEKETNQSFKEKYAVRILESLPEAGRHPSGPRRCSSCGS